MAKLEMKTFLKTIHLFGYYCRYLDDIFCIIDRLIDWDKTTDEFNGAHLAINLIPKKKEDSLPFFDVRLLGIPGGSMQRKVYYKAT